MTRRDLLRAGGEPRQRHVERHRPWADAEVGVDPLAVDRQFCDRGDQYRSAIFYHGEEQRRLAEESKAALERSGKLKGTIATQIVAAGPFYPAEEYHQDYYRKNPQRYKFYKWSCGRAQRLEELWGKQGRE